MRRRFSVWSGVDMESRVIGTRVESIFVPLYQKAAGPLQQSTLMNCSGSWPDGHVRAVSEHMRRYVHEVHVDPAL